MFCKNCGAQLQEGSVFCPMCGMNNAEDAAGGPAGNGPAVGVNPQNAAVSKVTGFVNRLGVKKIAAIAAAVVVVLIVLVIGISSIGSSGGLKIDKKSAISVGYGYFMDASGNAKEFDDLSSVYVSMNRSLVLYTDDSGDLYMVSDKLKTERIGSDVTKVLVGREGKYFAYLSNEDDDYSNQVLYIYSVSKGKSKKIDTDVYGDYVTISVSGETVAYAKDYDDGDFDTYIAGYSKSEKKIDTKSRKAVAVSNSGKKAYLVGNSDLYYYNGKESEKIEKDVSSSFWTNSDLSELVFTKNDSTYFVKPGKDPEKISNSAISSIIYPSTYYGTGYLGNYTQALGNDTIKGQIVYNTDSRLLWVNKKATDMVKIDSNVTDAELSADGKSIVYVSSYKVYKVSKFKESMEPKLLYDDEEIYTIAASSDLKKIYGYSYDDDDSVYYIKNSKKAEKISEDVDSYAFSYADGKLYFVSDEDLYVAKTSSSSKEKVSVDGDASYVYASLNGIVAFTRDGAEYTCYFINGKKPVKLYEED